MAGSFIDGIFVKDNIVHIGALLYLAGFLFRNQLVLRGLIVVGDLVYIAYFYFAPEKPLWGAMFWAAMFISVNVYMIGVILAEKMHFNLTSQERRLFDVLHDLTPGQFRALLKLADQGVAQAPMLITEEGKPLDRLYFVLDGRISIEKWGKLTETDPQTFIGEIAFLLNRPATATVAMMPGTNYFVWRSDVLKKAMEAKPALGGAIQIAMNRSLANKVAKSDVVAPQVRERVGQAT